MPSMPPAADLPVAPDLQALIADAEAFIADVHRGPHAADDSRHDGIDTLLARLRAALAGQCAAAPQPHPSRSAPRCLDCRHVQFQPGNERFAHCVHPSTPVRPLDGTPALYADEMRQPANRMVRQHQVLPCGPAGVLFTAR